MKTQPDPNHLSVLQSHLDLLGQASPYKIVDFIAKPLYDQHAFQGLYAISDSEDQLVYIGKTNDGQKEKALSDRIWGHAERNSSLQTALGVGREVFKSYLVRVIRIDDPELRGFTELYAIAVLRPRANRVCMKKALTK